MDFSLSVGFFMSGLAFGVILLAIWVTYDYISNRKMREENCELRVKLSVLQELKGDKK